MKTVPKEWRDVLAVRWGAIRWVVSRFVEVEWAEDVNVGVEE